MGERRGLGPNRANLKRHVSPLTNAAVSQVTTAATSITQQTTTVFSNASETIIKSPQQESQSVFGIESTSNQGNVFSQVDNRMSPSKTKVNHPSPLAGVTASPSKAGGSIMSGLSNQAKNESGNIASLTDKDKSSSVNLFQSAISSSGQPLDLQKKSQLQGFTNVASIFGGEAGLPTKASPNVNFFEQKEKPGSETAKNLTQNSTDNTSPFSISVNVENKALNLESSSGIFGNTSKSNSNLIASTSSNPIGLINSSIFGSANPNPNPVFGSVGLAQTSSQQANTHVFDGAGFPNSNTQSTTALTSNQVTNPSVFGGAGLPSTMAKPQNVSTDSNKVSIFGNAGLPEAGQMPKPGPFTTKSTNVVNPVPHLPNKASSFGSDGLPINSSLPSPFTSKSATQTSQFSNSAVNTSVPKTFSGQSRPSGIFTKNQLPKPGPFSSKSTNQTSQSPNFPGSSEGANLPPTFSGQFKPSGIFTRKQTAKPGPFTSKSTSQSLSQTPQVSIFGNAAQSSTSTSDSVFSRPSGTVFDTGTAGTNLVFSQTQRSETTNARGSGSVLGSQSGKFDGEDISTHQKSKGMDLFSYHKQLRIKCCIQSRQSRQKNFLKFRP